MKTIIRNRLRLLFISALIFIVSSVGAQQPTARELFEKMKKTIDTIKVISYNLDYRNVNKGRDDSVFWSTSKTWAVVVPSDTIFGAHLHVRQTGKNGKSDYYYDGINAMDIYHQSPVASLSKTVAVIEPYDQGSGYNVVQARTTVNGFSQELLSPVINSRWMKYLDSMKVKETSTHWLIQWTQLDKAVDFRADMEVALNKKNYIINYIKQHTVWQSVPMNMDTKIENIRINYSGDRDSIQLKENYTGYKMTIEKKPSKEIELPSMVGYQSKKLIYPSFSGGSYTLMPAKGKYMLLDFWETWCGYCFLAMPKVKELHEKYSAKGLEIVGVVLENKLQVEKIVKTQAFPYPTVFGDEKIKEAYKLESRPRYILLDDTGKVLADSYGDLEKIEKLIGERLK